MHMSTQYDDVRITYVHGRSNIAVGLDLDRAIIIRRPSLPGKCREAFMDTSPVFFRDRALLHIPLNDAKPEMSRNGLAVDKKWSDRTVDQQIVVSIARPMVDFASPLLVLPQAHRRQ